VYFVRPLGYVIKKLPVPLKQAIIRLINVKPYNALLLILLEGISIYLTSVLI